MGTGPSLLDHATPADIRLDPFPHIVIPVALALCALFWSWQSRGQDLIAARQAEALASEIARGNARVVEAVTQMGARNV